MNKIGIIITTFQRDELLFKSVESLLNNWQEHFRLIIIDQGQMNYKKQQWLAQKSFLTCITFPVKDYPVRYHQIPFNIGLSYARNFGIKRAKALGCDYVLIASDSFLFNESIHKINNLVNILNSTDYSLLGVELSQCVCDWEAKLNLIEGKHFELNFIDKKIPSDFLQCDYKIKIYDCDIVRNFFLAKTDTLLDVKWDENMNLGEHEDFFWRYKKADYKVGWTDYIKAEKMTDRPDEYAEYRKKNFREGIKKLKEKYNIKGWVSYKNLERAKRK